MKRENATELPLHCVIVLLIVPLFRSFAVKKKTHKTYFYIIYQISKTCLVNEMPYKGNKISHHTGIRMSKSVKARIYKQSNKI